MTGAERLQKKFVEFYTRPNPDLPPWNLLKYFTPGDFEDPSRMHPIFLLYLDAIRWEATLLAGRNVKIVVKSDARPTDKDSAHGTKLCTAADIRIRNANDRFFLLWACFNVGIKRIGIYCDDHHLHVDTADLIYKIREHDGVPWPTEVAWVRECGQ